jgi:phosphatidylethanolamine-binding protein (PEBP) family uncharacterized protein
MSRTSISIAICSAVATISLTSTLIAAPQFTTGPDRKQGQRPPRPPQNQPNQPPPYLIKPISTGKFIITSPALKDGDPLPKEFNGDGEGATLPLEWKGAPSETKSYAIVMDHIDRDNFLKTYWNVYAIPATTTSIPKNAKNFGTYGTTWKRDQNYVTPHSQGGGKHTMTIHIYAVSMVPKFDESKGKISREELLKTIKDFIIDSAEFKVTYQRPPTTN